MKYPRTNCYIINVPSKRMCLYQFSLSLIFSSSIYIALKTIHMIGQLAYTNPLPMDSNACIAGIFQPKMAINMLYRLHDNNLMLCSADTESSKDILPNNKTSRCCIISRYSKQTQHDEDNYEWNDADKKGSNQAIIYWAQLLNKYS